MGRKGQGLRDGGVTSLGLLKLFVPIGAAGWCGRGNALFGRGRHGVVAGRWVISLVVESEGAAGREVRSEVLRDAYATGYYLQDDVESSRVGIDYRPQ